MIDRCEFIEQHLDQYPKATDNLARQLEILFSMFEDDDMIEIRMIHAWKENPFSTYNFNFAHALWFSALELIKESVKISKRLMDKSRKGYNIFFTPNPRLSRINKFSGINDVKEIKWLFLDFDNVKLDEAIEALNLAKYPEPTIIVNSGNGMHAYWKLKTPLNTECSKLMKIFFDNASDKLPVKPDSACVDISRILRLPGTLNIKSNGYKLSSIYQSNDFEYELKKLVPDSLIKKNLIYPLNNFGFGSSSPLYPHTTQHLGSSGFPEEYNKKYQRIPSEAALEHLVSKCPIGTMGHRNKIIPKLVYQIREEIGLDVSSEILEYIHCKWYNRYKQNIRTDIDESFIEFMKCYNRMPIVNKNREDMVERTVKYGILRYPKNIAAMKGKRYKNQRAILNLIYTACEMSRENKSFFSYEQLGNYIDKPKAVAYKIIQRLTKLKLIKIEELGDDRKRYKEYPEKYGHSNVYSCPYLDKRTLSKDQET